MDTETAITGLSGIIALVAFVAVLTFYDDIKKKVKRLYISRKKYLRKRKERLLSDTASEVLFRTAKNAKFIVDEKLDIPAPGQPEKEVKKGRTETMENV